MGYKLFLDDMRMPDCVFLYTGNRIYNSGDWVIVRNYGEFVDYITINGIPSLISFDHDLADIHYLDAGSDINYSNYDEKTGYHCALWLVDYCMDNGLDLPEYLVHSMNTTGATNIRGLLQGYKKFRLQ